MNDEEIDARVHPRHPLEKSAGEPVQVFGDLRPSEPPSARRIHRAGAAARAKKNQPAASSLGPTAPAKRWGELQRMQNHLAQRPPRDKPGEHYVGRKFPGRITATMSQASGWGSGVMMTRRVVDEQIAVETNNERRKS